MAPAPDIVPADPKAWRQGFLTLQQSVVPCPGFTMANWGANRAIGSDCLEKWAGQAADLGWTTLGLFGVHPEIETVRADFCGALVLGSAMVTEVTGRHIKWLNATYRREQVGRPTDGRRADLVVRAMMLSHCMSSNWHARIPARRR